MDEVLQSFLMTTVIDDNGARATPLSALSQRDCVDFIQHNGRPKRLLSDLFSLAFGVGPFIFFIFLERWARYVVAKFYSRTNRSFPPVIHGIQKFGLQSQYGHNFSLFYDSCNKSSYDEP
jgi:hypothetical protein